MEKKVSQMLSLSFKNQNADLTKVASVLILVLDTVDVIVRDSFHVTRLLDDKMVSTQRDHTGFNSDRRKMM